ncbi:MAG: DUF4093 domain-containing protein [Oscillospiraceae bacterium]
MLHIDEVIIVEGKYDKEKLKKITDAPIICTHGFELYRSKQLLNSIIGFAETCGIIILTDSDSAGFRIRNYIKKNISNNGVIKNAYIPTIEGKEKRKEKAGKEGILGVEGTLTDILKKAATVLDINKDTDENKRIITKNDFYIAGLTGKLESAEMRKKLAKKMNLPIKISTNAMIDIINKTYGYDKFCEYLKNL